MPATNLPKVSARLETILASAYSPSATTYSLALGTDINGTALAGYYGLTIDGGTANEQFDVVTISGTTCTVVVRDCDPTNPLTSRTRTVPTHGKGASVKITDYPLMGFIRSLLNGDYTFDNILAYTAAPTFTSSAQIITKAYADALAIAGAPNASTSVKGILQEATAAQINSGTATGSTGAVLAVSPDQLVLSNLGLAAAGDNTSIAVGSGNKFMTQTGFQNGAEKYATWSGTNTITATYSPAPVSLVAGQEFWGIVAVTNTGAVTFNPNGLGAIPVKKLNGTTALVAGDLVAGQLVGLKYDGTNMQMMSPSANNALGTFKVGVSSHDVSITGTQTIAHGLGVVPKLVRITGTFNTTGAVTFSSGTFNGTTTAATYSQANLNSSSTGFGTAALDSTNIIAAYVSVSSYAVATIAVDATNITLTWSKTSTPTGLVGFVWEAQA